MAFPTTGILDTFNRADVGPPPSASWTTQGFFFNPNGLTVVSNACVDTGNGGDWGTQFGPDCEIYFTVTSLPADAGGKFEMVMRYGTPGDSATGPGYWIQIARVDANPGINITQWKVTGGSTVQLGAVTSDTSGLLTVGEKLGCEFIGSTWNVYRFRSGSWHLVATRTDSAFNTIGYIGIRTIFGGTFDDFGGGTTVVPPPTSLPGPIMGRGATW